MLTSIKTFLKPEPLQALLLPIVSDEGAPHFRHLEDLFLVVLAQTLIRKLLVKEVLQAFIWSNVGAVFVAEFESLRDKIPY